MSILSICGSLRHAWKFGQNKVIEESQWSQRKVEIVHAKKSKKMSCTDRVFSVLRRIRELCKNRFNKNEFLDNTSSYLKLDGTCYKNFVMVPFLTGRVVLVTDPNIIRSVLRHDRNESGREALFSGGISTTISKMILGDNLLSLPSDQHVKLRKAIAPEFINLSVNFPDILLDIFQKQRNNLEKGELLSKLLPRLVVEAVCRFFLKYEGPYEKLTSEIEILLKLVGSKRKSQFEKKGFHEALRFLRVCVNEACSQSKDSSFLKNVPKQYIEGLVALMFFAGQDTTSSLIEFLVHQLGQSDFQKLQDELFEEFKEGDLIDLSMESKLLDSIIQEGLRLFPPSFDQTRVAQKDLLVDGQFVIPRGSEIHLLHYFSQRDKRRWGDDAHLFNPTRFLNEKVDSNWYPFSAGLTECLGKKFALTFVKLFLALMLANYKWITKTPIKKIVGSVALKIVPDVQIQLSLRRSK